MYSYGPGCGRVPRLIRLRVLSDTVILTAYVLSWIGCAATFVNEDNRDFSALAGIAIWSIVLISDAAAVGAARLG